ncbi:alpha-amylase [Marchantia polymorpha subsp. ruderalis]|uniref:alpha-amylase n=2 Tax=Marchantia polymorpha TaxID=3197 RepID=A0AAF6AQR7_MARPO|nr:hypothetical protein MARPO_0033s0036 [Marchantia polymorpha]BBM98787.1 hypothetical protein Mp_1g16240 [Marchantia polymorpha subsp. ruderalis]|eukprot:PTQ41615.1 hypothetical protein MARPO_0033s0036 [Marchantia polymorpha]
MSMPLVFDATFNAPWNLRRPLRSRKLGFKSSEVYTASRIGAPCTAQIGHFRPKDASNPSSRRSQRPGSHSLSTSSRILWHERGAHGRRGVTAGVEKDKESSSSPEKHKRQIRPEVHGRRTRPGRPTPQGPYNNVLLQAFNWDSHKNNWWTTLKTKVEEICGLGITDVWLPPVSQSVDRQGYLPTQLYSLDSSAYGTSAQLKELIDEFHRQDICCIADIVINHRSGVKQDSKGHWNIFKGGNPDKRLDWGPWAVVDDDVYDSGGKGKHDTGESYGAAPDLDHTNKQVQDELTDWMNWMRAEIGFDGWRFDFVKGYHPKYTNLYCQRTNPTFAVGELWTSMEYFNGQLSWDQNKHRQVLCDWIDGTKGSSSAFDFTTKGILQRAVNGELWRLRDEKNKPPGLIGWYPQKAVTFLDNHDTGSTQRHWCFPDKRVLMGYAYILTHPGIPCIFIDHLYEFKLKNEIQKLVLLRKRNRINAKSKVVIQKAEADIYVAKIDERLILKLGSRMDMGGLLPDKNTWTIYMTGTDWAVWETNRPIGALPENDEDEPLPPPRSPVKNRPSHPVHLTSKMSEETKRRILKDVPQLVDPAERKKEHISILANGNGKGTPVTSDTPREGTPREGTPRHWTRTQKVCSGIFLLVVLLGPLLVLLIL